MERLSKLRRERLTARPRACPTRLLEPIHSSGNGLLLLTRTDPVLFRYKSSNRRCTMVRLATRVQEKLGANDVLRLGNWESTLRVFRFLTFTLTCNSRVRSRHY
jgi:hypothetical protein